MIRASMFRICAAALAALFATGPASTPGTAAPPSRAPFDLVIASGRVIDPETGLDAIRNVAVRGDRVVAVSTRPLAGRTVIDAKGLVVGPGLIDLHSHGHSVASHWLQAFDGVTTTLGLEDGAWPLDETYADMVRAGRPLNYGFSVGWLDARTALFGKRGSGLLTPSESARVVAAMGEGLDRGGLGVGVPVGYAPDTNHVEYLDIGRVAAAHGAPMFSHLRNKNLVDPLSSIESVEEAIATAAATGVHFHICHVNSLATRNIPVVLAMIRKAQSLGVPITTEAYPFGAGSTIIGAPFLAPNSLPLMGLRPDSIEYFKTGEHIADAARLNALRAADPNGLVLIHYLNESDPASQTLLDTATLTDGVMIASDTVPYTVNGRPVPDVWPLPANAAGHPRGAATFTTVLRRQVLDTRRMTMVEFFRRGSLLPARLLESTAAEMRDRGRLRVGAFADLIVFDPKTVRPRATYAHPAEPATGMREVIVGGRLLIRDGQLDQAMRSGRAIRGPIKG